MSDDKMNRGARDRARINLSQDYEVRDWTKSLGVDEDELKEAVHNVREYLKHRNHPSR